MSAFAVVISAGVVSLAVVMSAAVVSLAVVISSVVTSAVVAGAVVMSAVVISLAVVAASVVTSATVVSLAVVAPAVVSVDGSSFSLHSAFLLQTAMVPIHVKVSATIVVQLGLKLHSPMIFKSLHFVGINIVVDRRL